MFLEIDSLVPSTGHFNIIMAVARVSLAPREVGHFTETAPMSLVLVYVYDDVSEVRLCAECSFWCLCMPLKAFPFQDDVRMCRLSVVCRLIWWERAASEREKNGSSGVIVEPRGCGAVLSSTLKGSHGHPVVVLFFFTDSEEICGGVFPSFSWISRASCGAS